jgi:hypothetical protein
MKDNLEINDRIYGNVVIREPILIELIESPAIQRLKGINQFGMPQRFSPYPGFNRYEHSVGVMLVLRHLGAGVEEQSAGIIHDVSHTAFSHLVDWVMGNREREDYQDNNLQRIVSLSNIPEILKRYGLDSSRVTEIERYGLLEKPTPYLCADRIDYSLREFHVWANPSIVKQCIDDLVNHNGQIVFKTKDSAEKFAETYAKCQRMHWGGAEHTVRSEILTRALKLALEEKIIDPNDFYAEDEYLIGKLSQSENTKIKLALTILERPKLELQKDRKNPQFDIREKFRYIDPHYLENGTVYLLSESDPNYASFLEKQRTINERRIKVSLVR